MKSLSFLFTDFDIEDEAVVQRLELSTNEVSLLSHTHGRDRRAERGIKKRELQAAVKHGTKERAGSGLDAAEIRWKYTYKGVVYITDHTSRHEITSWRLDAKDDDKSSEYLKNDEPPGEIISTHIVLIVDHSGSMRRRDIGGEREAATCTCSAARNKTCAICKDIPTRTAAVYTNIVDHVLLPQLRMQQQPAQAYGVAVLSLIEMSMRATVAIRRAPINDKLLIHMREQRSSIAQSHGNYIAALDKLVELLDDDKDRDEQVIIFFLSDGAPSDHTFMPCKHGSLVWSDAPGGQVRNGGRRALVTCPQDNRKGSVCRKEVRDSVLPQCIERIERLRNSLGSHRISLSAVAFGPDSEDYTVLEAIALATPGRGTYSKLGLSTELLSTALSSLSSTLTSLRSSVSHKKQDLRGVSREDARCALAEMTNHSRLADQGEDIPVDVEQNFMFFGPGTLPFPNSGGSGVALSKSVWTLNGDVYNFGEDAQLMHGRGIAYRKHFYCEGAERFCFRGTEFVPSKGSFVCDGPPLVVKEARHASTHADAAFHDSSSKVQQICRVAADTFNKILIEKVHSWIGSKRPPLTSHCRVSFLPTSVYNVVDLDGHNRTILAEKFLEGRYTKWNNNFGKVLARPEPRPQCPPPDMLPRRKGTRHHLGSIIEEEEDERDEAVTPPPPPTDMGEAAEAAQFEAFHDVPQCFSHFSATLGFPSGLLLICDLQGTWNRVDGFQFTDPALHSLQTQGSATNYGHTDKAYKGIAEFFKTHKCGPLCEAMALKTPQATMTWIDKWVEREHLKTGGLF